MSSSASLPDRQPQSQPQYLSRGVILLLAFACGVAVANVYFPQAISPLIAHGLNISTGSAALVVTTTQLGYAAGVFLLVPLGDRVPHRPLIVTLLSVTCVGLVVAGLAPSLWLLVVASAVIGISTVVPQILIPMAAGLMPAERRGAVTGTLLSGLIGGILLARTFSGTLGDWLGWRAPYLVAAGVAALLTVVLAVKVPVTSPPARQSYPQLLAEPLRLMRAEPELRRSAFYQATVFAGFSAAWTSIALFVTGPAYGMGAPVVGLIALVGAGSMFATPIAGRWTDRKGPDPVNLLCMVGSLLAAAVLLGGLVHGVTGLVVMTVGMLVLDVAMQSGQVANQARIFALRPEVRSRLNTAYMTCSYIGGSIGSWLGVRAYAWIGWGGVCALVAVVGALALARHLLRTTRPAIRPAEEIPAEPERTAATS
jgi:predicted MFS family arabinose efflux permease